MKNPAPLHPRARCYKVSRAILDLGYRLLHPRGVLFYTIELLNIMYLPDNQSDKTVFNIILII